MIHFTKAEYNAILGRCVEEFRRLEKIGKVPQNVVSFSAYLKTPEGKKMKQKAVIQVFEKRQ